MRFEITGLSTTDWNQPMSRQSSLLCDRAVRVVKSKTNVFADLVLCLGGIVLHQSKLGKTKFNGIWRHGKIPRIHDIGDFSLKIQKMIAKEGSSSCQCTMTLSGEHGEIMKIVCRIPGML